MQPRGQRLVADGFGSADPQYAAWLVDLDQNVAEIAVGCGISVKEEKKGQSVTALSLPDGS